jgi:hypothetical protein
MQQGAAPMPTRWQTLMLPPPETWRSVWASKATSDKLEQAKAMRVHALSEQQVRHHTLRHPSWRMMPSAEIRWPLPTWLAEIIQTDNRAAIRQMREAQKCHGSKAMIQLVERQRNDWWHFDTAARANTSTNITGHVNRYRTNKKKHKHKQKQQ